jgi:plastocyanin
MKRSFAVLAGAILVMSVLAVPAMGGAGPTYTVQLGGFYGDTNPGSGNSFYPDSMQVHSADQLSFVNNAFHSATLLPLGTDPDAWLEANASAIGDPYYPIVTDPDDGAKGFKYNNGVLFGTETTCGTDTACTYDGSTVVSSNILNSDPFLVRLDVPVGSQVWVQCLIHPAMRQQVDVVDDATPVQTQAEIDADTATRLADEAADALALHEQLVDEHSSHNENGRKVWDVFAGYDTEVFSLYGFYPAEQKVKKGQAVEYHFDQLTLEDHTASIDRKRTAAKILSKDFIPMCDPDGDQGAGPDTPPELEGPPFCNDPTTLELEAAPKAVLGAGDGEYRGGTDLESPPISGAAFGGIDSFEVVFPKDLDKTITYTCVLHPFMRGKIKM